MTTDNLGYFRVVIEMALEEPMEIVEADEGDSPGRANGYYQAFSVTAESYSEAVGFTEETLAELFTREMAFTLCKPCRDLFVANPLDRVTNPPDLGFVQ